MIEATAVHTVYYRGGDEQKIAKPGETLSLSESDFADLERLGAVKGAAKTEKPAKAEKAEKPAKAGKPAKAEKPAAPAEPEQAAESSAPEGDDDNAMIG